MSTTEVPEYMSKLEMRGKFISVVFLLQAYTFLAGAHSLMGVQSEYMCMPSEIGHAARFSEMCLDQEQLSEPGQRCESSIELTKATRAGDVGLIEVSVTATGAFVCTLLEQKGSGPQKIKERSGVGNQKVKFEEIPSDKLYQVQVEFKDEANTRCRRLQITQVIIE